ncbi:uncharacterized protein LOC116433940 isoform X2 [Nomia melanderi]|uniref:uncharacterized protein LOC116433940 isoform X2 n=1 Tax=Nomia melanderi TaxID=2448451 RepID=UPI003FCDA2DE
MMTHQLKNRQPVQQTNVFKRAENAPLAARAQIKCFKCDQLGHTANQCGNFRFARQQQKGPPPVNAIATSSTKDETEISEETEEQSELIPQQETYPTYSYEEQEEQETDSWLTQEQESIYSNENINQQFSPTQTSNFKDRILRRQTNASMLYQWCGRSRRSFEHAAPQGGTSYRYNNGQDGDWPLLTLWRNPKPGECDAGLV